MAATPTNADLLGNQAGRLRAGRLTDFFLVNGDLLTNVAVLADVFKLRVFLGGLEIEQPSWHAACLSIVILCYKVSWMAGPVGQHED